MTGIRTIYATNGVESVNEHGDAFFIGDGGDGTFSVNVLSLTRGNNAYAIVSRDELVLLKIALDVLFPIMGEEP